MPKSKKGTSTTTTKSTRKNERYKLTIVPSKPLFKPKCSDQERHLSLADACINYKREMLYVL